MKELSATVKQEEKQYKNYTVNKAVIELIDVIQEEFPITFPQKPDKKVPLKIGIYEDLLVWGKDRGYSIGKIRRALRAWCQGRRYFEALSAENAVRIGLSGNITGEVNESEAATAKKQLEIIYARRKNCREQKDVELLTKQKTTTSMTPIQKLIPGAKTKANCADTCLEFMNSVNLNRRLIAMMYVYRNAFVDASQRTSNRFHEMNQRQMNENYERLSGFADCAQMYNDEVRDLLSKEDALVSTVVEIIRLAGQVVEGKHIRSMDRTETELLRRIESFRKQISPEK
jgi:sRNA-binding protein